MKITPDNRLTLASGSPRRKLLLESLGLTLSIVKPEINEDPIPGEYGAELAGRLAFGKAKAAITENKSRFILAADTVVVLNNELLGKPENESAANKMLTKLSSQSHLVITGCAIYDSLHSTFTLFNETTRVYFRQLAEDEIAEYILTGSPFDKAGGYGIQDPYGSTFISKIEGCFYNVMGLPVSKIVQELRKKWYAPGT